MTKTRTKGNIAGKFSIRIINRFNIALVFFILGILSLKNDMIIFPVHRMNQFWKKTSSKTLSRFYFSKFSTEAINSKGISVNIEG